MGSLKGYSIIIKISEKMKEKNYTLGKTALQKLIFILKELYNVPVEYEYKLHIFGPYSEEISADLDYLSTNEVLKVDFQKHNTYTGYNILPFKNLKNIIDEEKGFIRKIDDEINKVINDFGNKTAKELELKATIIYIKKEGKIDKQELIDRVKEIKPYFSKEKIEENIDFLSDYIN